MIEPVLDDDETTGSTSTASAARLPLDVVRERGWEIASILDRHAHADHLSAAHDLGARTGARRAIGARVIEMQRSWRDVFGAGSLACDGSQWDRPFDDGHTSEIGGLACRVLLSPGPTSASVPSATGDAAFVHGTLFMPVSGTARADCPGADPRRP